MQLRLSTVNKATHVRSGQLESIGKQTITRLINKPLEVGLHVGQALVHFHGTEITLQQLTTWYLVGFGEPIRKRFTSKQSVYPLTL